MRKKPLAISYETPEPEAPPLASWNHVAVTAILTFLTGAILLYILAGTLFRV